MKRFKGLTEKAKDFAPFTIVQTMMDPQVDDVWLLLIKFESGEMGLCVYNTEREVFIEEPADLELYETAEERIMARYWPHL